MDHSAMVLALEKLAAFKVAQQAAKKNKVQQQTVQDIKGHAGGYESSGGLLCGSIFKMPCRC